MCSCGHEPIVTRRIMQPINTANCVEAQNKQRKYSYLPRRKNISLSQMARVLYEEFFSGNTPIPRVHTINIGVCTGELSCTCPDWLQWHIPCKHFFIIFRVVEGWGWNALPDAYTKSAYLCADSTALSERYNLKPQSTADEAITEQGNNEDVTNPLQDVL